MGRAVVTAAVSSGVVSDPVVVNSPVIDADVLSASVGRVVTVASVVLPVESVVVNFPVVDSTVKLPSVCFTALVATVGFPVDSGLTEILVAVDRFAVNAAVDSLVASGLAVVNFSVVDPTITLLSVCFAGLVAAVGSPEDSDLTDMDSAVVRLPTEVVAVRLTCVGRAVISTSLGR